MPFEQEKCGFTVRGVATVFAKETQVCTHLKRRYGMLSSPNFDGFLVIYVQTMCGEAMLISLSQIFCGRVSF